MLSDTLGRMKILPSNRETKKTKKGKMSEAKKMIELSEREIDYVKSAVSDFVTIRLGYECYKHDTAYCGFLRGLARKITESNRIWLEGETK